MRIGAYDSRLGGKWARPIPTPYTVEIWIEADDSILPDHFWIKRSDDGSRYAVKHYYHIDSLLMWHKDDIRFASRVFVHYGNGKDDRGGK
jgi:hypothetical protein